jgi:hypothetical protein
LRFHILSDVRLAFAVPERIRESLTVVNVDLGSRQGDGRWMLPMPVTLVVGRRGEMAGMFMDCPGLDIDGVLAMLARLPR